MDQPMLSFQSSFSPPIAVVDTQSIDLSSTFANTKSPLITIHVHALKAGLWDSVNILPSSYLYDISSTQLNDTASISLRFNSAFLPLGQFTGEMLIRFSLKDKPVLGDLAIPISALIIGDVVSSPPSIYLGPVNQGGKYVIQIKLHSRKGLLVGFISSNMDNSIKITTVPQLENDHDLVLTCSFDFKDQSSASGIILLHVRTDREWILRIPYIGTILE